MRNPIVAVIGGGVYVPRLGALLARALPEGGQLRLQARRSERLRTIAAATSRQMSPQWALSATTSLAEAVDGADAVVLLARIGGLGARAWDESFPARFGLVGDEALGPGGFANGWRTLPLLQQMAQTLRQRCPRALVCNLMAPLGLTTRLLLDQGVRAVGLCELPLLTRERLLGSDGGEDELSYIGLNRVGWFWGAHAQGRARLQAAAARGEIDAPTLMRFGAAPLRHYYELFDRGAAARLGLERPGGRAEALAALTEAALAQLGRQAELTALVDEAADTARDLLAVGDDGRGNRSVANGDDVVAAAHAAALHAQLKQAQQKQAQQKQAQQKQAQKTQAQKTPSQRAAAQALGVAATLPAPSADDVPSATVVRSSDATDVVARVVSRGEPLPRTADTFEDDDDGLDDVPTAASGGVAELLAARPTPWFERALVPLLAARLRDAPWEGFVHVRNAGPNGPLVPALPSDAIVELEALVDDEIVAQSPPPCPREVAAFLRALAEAEAFAYEAARTRNARLLARAMEALPLALDPQRAGALVDFALRDPPPLDLPT